MRTKVFVGNLSFATKENELAKEFEAAGKVISANIITRGPRSLGYGFVEMDNEQDAANAVKLLDKKEIDGRPINVEVAKQREEGAENAEKPQGGATRGRGGARGTSRGRGRGGARGAPRGGANVEGGQRRRFKRREDEGEEGTQQQGEGQQQGQGEGSRGRGGRGRGRGGVRGASRGSAQPRPPREQTEKKEDTRAPSKTTLFVANLPFTLDDEGFSKIFKDNSLAYKSAHVVKKRSGRSKGFGFVEFDNEVDQQKALTAIDKKQVEGREVVVKVALTENKPTEGETSEKKETATTTATDAKVSTPKTENKATTASPKTDKK